MLLGKMLNALGRRDFTVRMQRQRRRRNAILCAVFAFFAPLR